MPRRHKGGAEVYLHSFITSALDGDACVSRQPHATDSLTLGKKLSVHTEKEAGWSLESVWRFSRRETFLAPPRNQTLDH